MKILKIAGAVIAVSFASNISAQEYQFVAVDNSPETQFCVSVGNNNVDNMKSELSGMGFGNIAMRRSINEVKCNELSAAQFAHKYMASETFSYLNNRSAPINRAKTSVTINDIARVENSGEPILVYVSAL